jgi:histidinol-phosphate aminotransferase
MSKNNQRKNQEKFQVKDEDWLKNLRRATFDRLKAYTPGEQPQDISEWIKLNTNENPNEPPQEVIDSLHEAITLRLRMYPDPTAKDLKQAIADNYLKPLTEYNKLENICVANGCDELLDILFKIFITPGDNVVYCDPSYGMYPVLAESYDAVKVVVPLNEDDFSIQDITFRQNDKIFIICSPNNPDGNTVPLEKIEEICNKFPGVVYLDETYGDFAETTAFSLLPKCKNLIVGKSFSKSSSLASIRLGFAVSHRNLIQLFETIRLPYNVTYLTQVAGIAAMNSWKKIKSNIDIIVGERNRMSSELKKIGYEILPTQSNFYLIRFKDNFTANKIFNKLKEQKILVRYWSNPQLGRYIRITVGSKSQNDKLLEFMTSLFSQI